MALQTPSRAEEVTLALQTFKGRSPPARSYGQKSSRPGRWPPSTFLMRVRKGGGGAGCIRREGSKRPRARLQPVPLSQERLHVTVSPASGGGREDAALGDFAQLA